MECFLCTNYGTNYFPWYESFQNRFQWTSPLVSVAMFNFVLLQNGLGIEIDF